MIDGFYKVVRYFRIYGFRRTVAKVFGRTRLPFPRLFPFGANGNVGLIGCGQFGFSTIAFFLGRRRKIRAVYDVNRGAAEGLARFYGIGQV